MSLFALHVEDGVLYQLPDEAALRSRCPLTEVRAEAWLFFAEDGSPVRPQFRRGEAGDAVEGYYLRPWASCGSCSLSQAWPMVRRVEGGVVLEVLAARFAPPAAGEG